MIQLSPWDAELRHDQRAAGAGVNAGTTVDAVTFVDYSVLIGHQNRLARAGIHTSLAGRALVLVTFTAMVQLHSKIREPKLTGLTTVLQPYGAAD